MADFGISGVESSGSAAIVFMVAEFFSVFKTYTLQKGEFPPALYVSRGPYNPRAACRNFGLIIPEILRCMQAVKFPRGLSLVGRAPVSEEKTFSHRRLQYRL